MIGFPGTARMLVSDLHFPANGGGGQRWKGLHNVSIVNTAEYQKPEKPGCANTSMQLSLFLRRLIMKAVHQRLEITPQNLL
ncbi:hypothetical protein QTO31_11330 [Chloroflexus sp. MS-CIW-1]|jgi:hypothetical protein|uniref:hypothetical protein n=1 Tax=unclassified Chloroflexus TaxID=2633855 RepID=UPI0004DF653C|nr:MULTISPECIES: hypothetical protein [unclassified Chloroflexus]MDN5272563.1 hypothetical protein [Chloroflexus sp. MS-CIW-1]